MTTETFFRALLGMSLQACYVIAAVLAVRFVLTHLRRPVPRGYVYLLWSAVLFRLLCPVSFSSVYSLFSALGRRGAPVTVAQDFGTAAVARAPAAAASSAAVTAAPAAAVPAAASGLRWIELLFWLWAAGAAALLFCGAVSWLRLRRRLGHSQPDAGGVRRVHGLETAFVAGLVRPRIYLPAGLDAETERCILAHERVHLRRGDPLWRLLGWLALCLHWFNPLVWIAYYCSGRDMEMSCDEAAIRQLGPHAKKTYSASLLSLAAGRRMLPGTPLAFGEGDTRQRVRNVLSYRRPAFWAMLAGAAGLTVLVLFLVGNAAHRADAAVWRVSLADGGSFRVALTLPDGWTLGTAENDKTDDYAFVAGGKADKAGWTALLHNGETVGAAYCLQVTLDADSLAALHAHEGSYYMPFYSAFMMGSSTSWDGYTAVHTTDTAEGATARAEVYYSPKTNNEYNADHSAQYAYDAALYYDTDYASCVVVLLDEGALTGEELNQLAVGLQFADGVAAGLTGSSAAASSAASPAASLSSTAAALAEFEKLLSSPGQEQAALAYLTENGPQLPADAASQMVLQLESYQQQSIAAGGLVSETLAAQLTAASSGTLSEDALNDPAQIPDPETSAAVQELRSRGYRIIVPEGMFEAIIDYTAYQAFDGFVTPDMASYIKIMSVESQSRTWEDAAILPTISEVFQRARSCAAFLQSWPNSAESDTVYELYTQYIDACFLGANNTPAFSYDDLRLESDFRSAYQAAAADSSDPTMAQAVSAYLSVLQANDYTLNDAVTAYRETMLETLRSAAKSGRAAASASTG